MLKLRMSIASAIFAMVMLVAAPAAAQTCLPIVGCFGGLVTNNSNTGLIVFNPGEGSFILSSGSIYGGWGSDDADSVGPGYSGHTLDIWTGVTLARTVSYGSAQKINDVQHASCFGSAPSPYCNIYYKL